MKLNKQTIYSGETLYSCKGVKVLIRGKYYLMSEYYKGIDISKLNFIALSSKKVMHTIIGDNRHYGINGRLR